jgi:hypothetical protein
MFDMIKSTPAKICLVVSAIVPLVYSLNFMLWADCYVTGGAGGCFTILSNETVAGMSSYGGGGPETAFNGTLMFGIFISTAIILNEGAKGMWKIMLPVMAGLITMTAVIWAYWGDIDASETPKYVVPVVTLIYIASYFLLRAEDEVDDGLSDFKVGVNVEDKGAVAALGILILMGAFYCLRAILMPGDTVDSYELGTISQDMLDAGLGTPSEVTVAVGGSLFLVYFLWTVITLMDGAKGKWALLHPGIFFTLAVVISNYTYLVGNIGEVARPVSDQSTMDALTGPLALLLLLFAYYRMRDEGVEDGMTLGGEEMSPNAFNIFLIMWTFGLGLMFTANMMMG